MSRPPHHLEEGVITRQMWIGIIIVGSIMAVGTLLVLDASLPGGFIAGNHTMRYAQTMAFTTLMMFQLFNAFNARSDEQSRFPRNLSKQMAVVGRWFVAATFNSPSSTRRFCRKPFSRAR